MRKLKNLKDGKKFTMVKGGVIYSMQKLDRKRKVAIFTATVSGKTFTRNWETQYYSLV